MAAPKKAVAKKSSASQHPAYKDMIKDAVLQLKERNGSSRQALKKYIHSNYKINAPNFESLFNTALRRGVQTGDFVQPKGPSGTVKLKKKEVGEKKPVAKKTPAKAASKAPKKVSTKTATAATKKAPATKKKAAPAKKAPAVKKTASKVTKKAPVKRKAAPAVSSTPSAPKKRTSRTSSGKAK